MADSICERVAKGESLRSICETEEMPDRSNVFRWLGSIPEFRDQYAHAKEESANAMAEEILEIADDGTNDWMEKISSEGEVIGWQLNGEHIQRSKLRVDTRKWLMAKLQPKKYGEKLELAGDKESPLQIIINGKDAAI